ncbi:PSD1 and planctomycete cytochrome C domain-containing protein [Novipirellula artificiosorum]|uniref:Planctomycete cytochrome C n=1 Tax=Novipirellula artificiosorum TaxID=2528016 RepID=A0A5C6E4B1_9BACT|nr:PSD1 and planctomycete cytochrome C domain-containing protein [Novipirellula artificiosorum]TWU42827.1 Planctomycete cytochrome C [Novipirellula artificiosorum]
MPLTAPLKRVLVCRPIVFSAIVLALLCSMPSPVGADAPGPTREGLDFFETSIRPLLVDHCYECHSREADEKAGDLYLDSATAMLRGGARGSVLSRQNPIDSLFLTAIRYDDADLQMPPDGKLDSEVIQTFQRWIEMGAPDPRGEVTEPTVLSGSPMDKDPRSHWAFVRPVFPEPSSRIDDASQDRIDAFAADDAAAIGLEIVDQASKPTLIRRVYFDLTGLPPTKTQVDRFVASDRPDSFERVVDALLASPEFGERFGRHWLDVARYADTVGYALAGKERRIKGSHRYRDWVIHAFASDMPYSEMILHQLAGDRTDPQNEAGNLDAMGFLTIGRRFLNPLDTMDDRIDVISRGLLGMTVSCARCHDHKFDPIPAADYYALFGILHSSRQNEDGPSPLMMTDVEKPHDSPILLRGQAGNRGEIAPRQYLTALRTVSDSPFTDGSGRLEFATKIAASDNPLTSRVIVNRLWGHLIGKPLVDSTSDLGIRTDRPRIAEVLEEFSADFSQHQSIKKTVRRIVLSRIYQQSADANRDGVEKDPDNQLLARANRRRRDFESLRDSLLQVSGSLDQTIGGEPVEITLPMPTNRRTVYALIDRQNLPGVFRTFDFASPDTHSPQRYFTTVPQQSLYLMNSPQVVELARRTAAKVRAVCETCDEATLASTLVEQVLARELRESEFTPFVAFLKQPVSEADPIEDPRRFWTHGTATLDPTEGVHHFKPFGIFQKGQWQTEAAFPADGPFGYASLSREGGHPGRQKDGAVVRRWTSPQSGVVTLRGTLGHRSDQGDGVLMEIWCDGKRLFGGVQKGSNRPYGPITVEVERGDAIDFAANCHQTDAFDSFAWRVQLKLTRDGDRGIATDSVRDFDGPIRTTELEPLDRLEQLAQVLLMSNEFAFVD